MNAQLMQEEWNAMASRNPFFSITSWPDFEDQQRLDLNFFWKIGALHGENLLDYLQLCGTENMDMLEIGCGLGRMTHHFATRFRKVYALDISEVMIEQAKLYWKDLENVEFFTNSGADLQPIADNKVDFVFSFYVLNHIVEPQIILNYIREAARVLKPKGLALLHFRIPRDYPLWNKSIMQRLSLALRRVKPKDTNALWWNTGIEKIAREYKTSLSEDFSRLASWNGCEVAWEEVTRVIKESKLKIINTDSTLAAHTQFAFVTLRK